MTTAMNEAEKLARDCDESADIWANEIDTRRKAAALLRRQAEQIKVLREALEVIADDYADRFDLECPSTNPGIKSSIRRARSALAATKEAE